MSDPTADRPAASVLPYGRPARGSAVWRWVRPGSVGFFGIVLILAALATWGGWRWRLKEDERAFNAETRPWQGASGGPIGFLTPPTRAALRHLARLPGRRSIFIVCNGPLAPTAFEPFRTVRLAN